MDATKRKRLPRRQQRFEKGDARHAESPPLPEPARPPRAPSHMERLPVDVLENICTRVVASSPTWRTGFRGILSLASCCKQLHGAISGSYEVWGREITFYFPELFLHRTEPTLEDFKAIAAILSRGAYMVSELMDHMTSYTVTTCPWHYTVIGKMSVITYCTVDVVRTLIGVGYPIAKMLDARPWSPRHASYATRMQSTFDMVERRMEEMGIACDELRPLLVDLALSTGRQSFRSSLCRIAYAWDHVRDMGIDPRENVQAIVLYSKVQGMTLGDLLSRFTREGRDLYRVHEDAFFSPLSKIVLLKDMICTWISENPAARERDNPFVNSSGDADVLEGCKALTMRASSMWNGSSDYSDDDDV